jgi:hypothetical protein
MLAKLLQDCFVSFSYNETRRIWVSKFYRTTKSNPAILTLSLKTMEINWTVLIPIFAAIVALIIFFVARNFKDKKELMNNLIKQEEVTIHEEHDDEIKAPE